MEVDWRMAVSYSSGSMLAPMQKRKMTDFLLKTERRICYSSSMVLKASSFANEPANFALNLAVCLKMKAEEL
jgi:hypothetical protein